jgi:hypothetical protein
VAIADHPKNKAYRSASDAFIAAEIRFISILTVKHSDLALSAARIERDKALAAYLNIIDELD